MEINSNVVRQLLQVSSSSEGETDEEEEEEEAVPELEQRPPTRLGYLPDDAVRRGGGGGKRRLLSRQLSLRETRMEAKWENRRRQIWERRMSARKPAAAAAVAVGERTRNLTDEDMEELRGSIDLGFGFSEEAGGKDLCRTLPALNLYFAVNRQLSDPKLATPPSPGSTGTSSSSSTLGGHPSPRSPAANEHVAADDWKIYNPGDSPQHVKTRLRHWAQVVAFTLRQNC